MLYINISAHSYILPQMKVQNKATDLLVTAKRVFNAILHCRERLFALRDACHSIVWRYVDTIKRYIHDAALYAPSALAAAPQERLESAGKAGISRLNAIITRTYYL